MLITEAFPSKFLSAADLQGRVVRVQIERFEWSTMNDGKRKLVAFFHGKQKGLTLNKTNANTIMNTYGPDTDNWIGAEVELFEAMVDFQGKTVPAVRVRVPQRTPQTQRQTQPTQQTQPAQPRVAQEPPFNDDIPF